MTGKIDICVGNKPGVIYASVGSGPTSETIEVAISGVGIVVIKDHVDLSGEWRYDNLVWNLALTRVISGNLFVTVDSATGRLRLFNSNIGEYMPAFDRLQLMDKLRILECYRANGHTEIPGISVIKMVSAISYADLCLNGRILLKRDLFRRIVLLVTVG